MQSPALTPFQPVHSGANSSSPTFSSTLGSTSQAYALESTGIREWPMQVNRQVMITTFAGDMMWVNFGSSTVVASTGVGVPILGGTQSVLTISNQLTPASTLGLYVAIASSTSVIANFTLGIGF